MELLVVLLIVGILVAVALPQYEFAVMKSRAATLLPILKNIVNAQDVYYMANGSFARDFVDLDIDVPSGGEIWKNSAGFESVKYPKWQIDLERQQVSGSIFQQDKIAIMYQLDYSYELDSGHFPGQKKCIAFDQGGSIAEKVCKSFGGSRLSGGTSLGQSYVAWRVP